jgi:hypothetical protein
MTLFTSISDVVVDDKPHDACEESEMLDCFIGINNKTIFRLIDLIRNLMMKIEEDESNVTRGHV